MKNHQLELFGEVWRAIPGYEGRYEASNKGRVKSLLRSRPRVLKNQHDERGRPIVTLYKTKDAPLTRTVHQLVLEAFVGPKPIGLVCCHADDDRKNNNLDNLRWDTPESNRNDARLNGCYLLGEDHQSSKLTKDQVMTIIFMKCKGFTIDQLADRFSVDRTCITSITNGRTWNHLTGFKAIKEKVES